MLSGDRPRNHALEAAFPLYIKGEFDFFYKHSPWPIGLTSAAPSSLKKKVAAAFVTEITGDKSIDRILKRYDTQVDYPETKTDRLDLRIRSHVDRSMQQFGAALMAISYKRSYQDFGTTLSCWTLHRAPFAIEIMAYCAQRGAIFEFLCIMRSLIEQMAWACAVRSLADDSALDRFQAQRCIRHLKAVSPRCGQLYGWLSDHAHWSVEAHSKSMISKDGFVGHLYASCYFKALSFAAMLLLVLSYFEVLGGLFWKPRSAVIELSCASPRAINKLKKLTASLFLEILALEKDDAELNTLGLLLV